VCLKGNFDKGTEQMFRNLETVKQQIMDLDPNVERSMPVRRTLQNGTSCYRKMYEEKKEATSVQTTIDKYFFLEVAYSFFTRFVAHFFNKRFFSLLAFQYSLYIYLCTQLKRILKAKIKSSDECSKTSWMNYNFSDWFLISIYAVSIYTVHSLHELTAYIYIYVYIYIDVYL
jgi:hypothetical protein